MARTLVNVSDSMIAGIVTSKRIKEFDETVLNDEAAVIESSI